MTIDVSHPRMNSWACHEQSNELEIHGSLHVFYDSPIFKNGKWTVARHLGEEIPSYMFPELEECCRQKFIGMIGDLENKLPKVVELVNANNIKK